MSIDPTALNYLRQQQIGGGAMYPMGAMYPTGGYGPSGGVQAPAQFDPTYGYGAYEDYGPVDGNRAQTQEKHGNSYPVWWAAAQPALRVVQYGRPDAGKLLQQAMKEPSELASLARTMQHDARAVRHGIAATAAGTGVRELGMYNQRLADWSASIAKAAANGDGGFGSKAAKATMDMAGYANKAGETLRGWADRGATPLRWAGDRMQALRYGDLTPSAFKAAAEAKAASGGLSAAQRAAEVVDGMAELQKATNPAAARDILNSMDKLGVGTGSGGTGSKLLGHVAEWEKGVKAGTGALKELQGLRATNGASADVVRLVDSLRKATNASEATSILNSLRNIEGGATTAKAAEKIVKDLAAGEKAARAGQLAMAGAAGKASRQAGRAAGSIGGTVMKQFGKAIPFVNAGLAVMDTNYAFNTLNDSKASWLKKGLASISAGTSWVACSNFLPVSLPAGLISAATGIAASLVD